MRSATDDHSAASSLESGAHERHLAISAVAQQISQGVGVVAMLVAVTVLARHLALDEFGTYGVLVSLAAVVVFLQTSVSTAAVKAFAEATNDRGRNRAFATTLTLYLVAGLLAAVILGGIGLLLLDELRIPVALHHQARLAIAGLAATTFAAWPTRTFYDVLRGEQRFVAAAVAEGGAYVGAAVVTVALTLSGAPLWMLVVGGASVPLLTGLIAALLTASRGLRYRYSRRYVTLADARSFIGLSGYLIVMGFADVVIYSLDRAILAGFRSASAVGLYEGPARAHALVRQVNGTLGGIVLPAGARYIAEGDASRTHDLLIRGMRYTLAIVVPLTAVLCVLARPILRVWLGQRFEPASVALILLVGYWLLNANTGVPGALLLAAGRVRALTLYAAAVGLLNLLLSFALTPRWGLRGVVLGTSVSYVAGFPFFVRLMLSTFPVTLRELAREVWIPAYSIGLLVGAELVVLRLTLQLSSALGVCAVAVAALVTYAAAYYIVWLRPNERLLLQTIVGAFILRRR